MTRKAVISIILAILMLALALPAGAQDDPVTLPEFISAYAARSIYYSGEYKDTFMYDIAFDDEYLVSVCNSLLFVDLDLTIKVCSTTFSSLTDDSKDAEYYMPTVLSTIAAIELGYCPELMGYELETINTRTFEVYGGIVNGIDLHKTELARGEYAEVYRS